MRFSVIIYVIVTMMIVGCNTPNKTDKTLEAGVKQPAEKTSADKQSEATMKTAMAFMGAMGKGDMEAMKSLMHEDMVWHNEGDKSMPWIGPWNGKKAILEEFMPVFGSNFKTVKWETEDSMASGNTAAFFGRMAGQATKTGITTEDFTFALRVKVKDGKIILWNWFEDSYAVSKAYHGE